MSGVRDVAGHAHLAVVEHGGDVRVVQRGVC
jgi:hypothetical protein